MSRITLDDAMISLTVGDEKLLNGIEIFHNNRVVDRSDLYLSLMVSGLRNISRENLTVIGNKLATLLGEHMYPNARIKPKPKFNFNFVRGGWVEFNIAVPDHCSYNWMELVTVDREDFCTRFREVFY